METEIIIKNKIKISTENIVDILANSLCCADTFVSLDYKEEDGKEAENEINENDCREVLWTKILENGKSIKLMDCEGQTKTLTLKKLLNGIKLYFTEGYATCAKNMEELLENGDFYDYDAILQFALYGEVIYG